VFAHANGYPPEAYQALLERVTAASELWTVEHRPFWIGTPAPTRLSWRCYADDLLVTLAEYFSRPVWLLGHSMGGVCSLMAAAAAPERIAGVMALDPVLIPDRAWWLGQTVGRLRPNVLPIVQRALRRPHNFESLDEAFAFYRSKRPFARVADRVLRDYVASAHAQQADGSVTLRWSGDWEACVYRSAPRLWSTLQRLQCPTLGLIGGDSEVLGAEATARWRRVQPTADLITLDGGHLLPLEAPEICAHHINEYLMTAR
jgi:pimeloyl-ACP methyl ester carboxylesterase